MDCDGPKHALIRDLDGSFVGTYPVEGSVVPFAEIRFASPSHDVSQCTLGYMIPITAFSLLGLTTTSTGFQ